ncbi:hypothetical protein DWB85_02505 [Seongchinamella sediminis]|uniref:Uncharacterized protein n=1 Tax=Seongchinamella sediminis TaxID=2283635 RepID=A0A3L7E3F0_9GAMM|nr:hypothetical protein [Seongchinamella sediminis]RLQ23445.1 hypothetical protein DWB85_02505 [Seongchinamella sediminis]
MNRTKLYSAVAAGLLLSAGYSAQSQVQSCVLEIAPGAVIVGASNEDFLVIEQGCQIDAEGTAGQPIRFTAAKAVTGEVEDNERGLWGGLVINGFAPINDCPEGVGGGTAECTKEGEANSGIFGGADPEDSSGILKYVVVSYAGSNVDPENQLNGIAFQGVGSGTEVDYVQVHNNLDDGIEFFGGTVSAKHVVLTGNADDSLDWTDGWQGNIQYLYVEQSGSGDNLIEADNREGDENALPRSLPAISNMSAYGLAGENGLRFRRGTGIHLSNSFVVDSGSCLRIGGESRNLLGGDLTIAGTSFGCTETHADDEDGAVEAYLESAEEVSRSGGQVNPVTPMGDFFEPAAYIGAISGDDWTAGWTAPGSVSNGEGGQPGLGCPVGTEETGESLAGKDVCSLAGTLTRDVTLTSSNHYELNGKVVVGGDNTDSATLTVQAGTTVYGPGSTDFLVVSRGSELVVNGTANAPVTFTGLADLQGNADIETTRGLWGGVVINGHAPINDCPEGATGGSAGCTKEGEANSGLFGGADPTDSSGSLKYMVVKYAGSNVDPENQLNGIAFQGVGSGTEVDYVQVHNNLDDGIEFFGGTVSAKHVVLTGNADDSLDWTDGWQGSIQFLLINQGADSADNGIEADNREGDENALPRSTPMIANMSIAGNPAERGVRLRRGTGLRLYSSYVKDNATCLDVSGESLSLLGTDIDFDGVSFNCPETVDGDNPELQSFLDSIGNVSQNGGPVAAADLSGMADFESTDFIGAVGEMDWTAGWTVGDLDTGSPGFAPPVAGCPDGTTEGEEINGTPTCALPQSIISDLQLTAGKFYILDGKTTVGGDNIDSATLTVAAGVTIVGDDAEDFLVISRGSQIVANGSSTAPVTLTAIDDVEGVNLGNARGLWGGLVINGNAPINDCPQGAAGGTVECSKEGEANSGLFGGADAGDSSGVLNYVVVKYAGSNVDPENQLNGIAFQGVGSGTEVDYVQVHNNLDDGIEFFGGTVDARHVVLSGNADDSLDWTDGWQGRLQYVHIVQGDDSADNGIEADNREGDENAVPRSKPTIANLSIIGNAGERAIRLRRGSGADLYNTAVTGSATCLDVDGDTSVGLLGTGINIESASFDCPEVVDGENPELQNYLDGAVNVSQHGSDVPAATLPADGFFEQSGVVGSDFDSWKGSWVFGQ